MTYISQRWTTSAVKSSAIVSAAERPSVCTASSTSVRRKRSAAAPRMRPKTNIGIVRQKPTNPTETGEPVLTSTTQPAVMISKW